MKIQRIVTDTKTFDVEPKLLFEVMPIIGKHFINIRISADIFLTDEENAEISIDRNRMVSTSSRELIIYGEIKNLVDEICDFMKDNSPSIAYKGERFDDVVNKVNSERIKLCKALKEKFAKYNYNILL